MGWILQSLHIFPHPVTICFACDRFEVLQEDKTASEIVKIG
jgi:hypothetical protein